MKGMKKREREGRASPSPPPPTPASSSPQPLRARCRLFLLPAAVDAAVPLVACRSSMPPSLSLAPPPPSSPSSLSPPPPPPPKRVQRSAVHAVGAAAFAPVAIAALARERAPARSARAVEPDAGAKLTLRDRRLHVAAVVGVPACLRARAHRREGACNEHAHSAGARGRRRCVTHGRASALTRALRQAWHAGACSASHGPSAPCMVAHAWRCAARERASSLSVIFPVSIPPLAFTVITVPRVAPHLLSWRGGGGPWYIV